MNQTNSQPKVLVVGGGFGGVKAALELSKSGRFAITLLSDRPNFYYYPTLYHTATGGPKHQSCIPLDELFAGTGVDVVVGTAATIDRAKKTVATTDGSKLHYDSAIFGLGVVTNYFGIPGLQEFAYGIKSPDEALRFKNHLHDQLVADGKPDMNYVIVGGGPTGIELAGQLPTYLREIMKAHDIKYRKIHVDLVEAAPQLVPRMPKTIGNSIARRLRKLGIDVMTGKMVQGATADSLMVSDKPIQSHTIVWTAGVANHPFFKENNFTLNERGIKVAVNHYLEAEDDVYVIGDNADTQYSGVAQTALYDAIFVARNLERKAKGELMKQYVPREPIYVLPAGPGWAAVQWGKKSFFGRLGWLLRSAADFIGFKDLEPWWKATIRWTAEFQREEQCAVCAKHFATNDV
jgi:NADH:ubiquinone reductase (H+-translocating)